MSEKKEKTKNNDEEKDNQNSHNEDHETNLEADSDKLEANKKEHEAQDISKEKELLEEIISLKEEKIRLLAEMENIRKRFERDKSESIRYGAINLARDFLSPGDNIERALSAFPQDEKHSQPIKNLIDGLKMVQKEFATILEKNGIKRIESLDAKFDPELHQAMMEVEDEDIDEGIVVQEIQAGYTMHERLLRPAMVGVSKKPSNENNKEVGKLADIEDDKKNLKTKNK